MSALRSGLIDLMIVAGEDCLWTNLFAYLQQAESEYEIDGICQILFELKRESTTETIQWRHIAKQILKHDIPKKYRETFQKLAESRY